MQKGMSTRSTYLKLSAALSLPSLGLLCLSLPAQADAGPQPTPSAHLSQAATAGAELSPTLVLPNPSTVTTAPSGLRQHARVRPQTEPAKFEVLFSQADTPDAEEVPKGDVFSPLPDSAPEDASPTVGEDAEAAEETPTGPSDTPDVPEAVDGESTGGDSPAEPASPAPEAGPALEPLPEPAVQPSPETSVPETPVPEAAGEAIPIPVETVVDGLQFLDPNPNPLLIQTQPEEVEIIGTQPVSLEEAIELAYRNNPDLRTAQLELEQSQAALREAQAALFPTVSVSGQLQGQNTTSTSLAPGGGIETSESIGAVGQAQLDATYSLFSSGARAASIRAAQEQVRLSELEVERRQEELRINVANDYYDLQEAIESIRINEAFLEEAERNLRDTSLREEVGVGTRFDVLRAEVQVANAEQDLVNSQANRRVAERVLANSLNVPPSLSITTVPVEIAGSWSLSLEESIVQAFQNRAELEQQLTQREISEQLRRQELAALGPQVNLFANYLISDTLTTSDSFNDTYQFGVQVSMDLFEGGAARARARQQELNIEIADRTFEETRNAVRADVETAFFTLQSNFDNIDTASLAVEQAQEALDLAILRFEAGVGTQLDILDAQSELTDAEVNRVQAIVGYNRSLASLVRAVSNIPESAERDLPF